MLCVSLGLRCLHVPYWALKVTVPTFSPDLVQEASSQPRRSSVSQGREAERRGWNRLESADKTRRSGSQNPAHNRCRRGTHATSNASTLTTHNIVTETAVTVRSATGRWQKICQGGQSGIQEQDDNTVTVRRYQVSAANAKEQMIRNWKYLHHMCSDKLGDAYVNIQINILYVHTEVYVFYKALAFPRSRND